LDGEDGIEQGQDGVTPPPARGSERDLDALEFLHFKILELHREGLRRKLRLSQRPRVTGFD
jgi:hypothetical protein